MTQVEPSKTNTAAPPRGRSLFLFGLLLFLAGPIAYGVQIYLKRLTMPWYLPVLVTLGIVLMLASVVQRRGVLRIAVLTICALLGASMVYFMFVGAKSPEYTGPAREGQKLPAFTASLADGSTFTNADLEEGTPAILVFFRGRW